MHKGQLLAEGKTKRIWATDPGTGPRVLIESKDDITAGDGARHDVIGDKGAVATTTTDNCFRALRAAGIPNHFIEVVDERTFAADSLVMIPVEIVVRRIATGSYLRRRPDVPEGTILPYVVEFFDKDDSQHDPLVIYDFVSNRVLYYDPKKPLATGFLKEVPMQENANVLGRRTLQMRELGVRTFRVLEDEWASLGVTLVDLKIECGTDDLGNTIVGDVIDNDSWRIWPGGEKALMKDKQVYRDMATTSDPAALAKELGKIKENFAWVADQTDKFTR